MAESLKARLRHAANRVLNPLGLHLTRAERAFEMDLLLARAVARGLQPSTVIDIGASDGVWSLRARRCFPHASFLLFEPLAERQTALALLKNRHGFEIVPAVAGAKPGTVPFNVDPAFDGSGVTEAIASGTRQLPVETIDAAVTGRGLAGPFVLKLDTHGYEIPVLEGATTVLSRTDLLVIETYNFTLTPRCLRFHELCAWLEQRGFRCCDMADPMRRPGDGVLWQMDLAFVPVTNSLFASNSYK